MIAINNSWRLVPWADVLYACDFGWWKAMGGVPDFQGLKISQDPAAVAAGWGVKRVKLKADDNVMRFAELGVIGSGGNWGFQAINLAVQFGVSRIVLVGFDMHLHDGIHWHGNHDRGLRNPKAGIIDQWRQRIDDAAAVLIERGVSVINAGSTSALSQYPKMSLEEALDHAA